MKVEIFFFQYKLERLSNTRTDFLVASSEISESTREYVSSLFFLRYISSIWSRIEEDEDDDDGRKICIIIESTWKPTGRSIFCVAAKTDRDWSFFFFPPPPHPFFRCIWFLRNIVEGGIKKISMNSYIYSENARCAIEQSKKFNIVFRARFTIPKRLPSDKGVVLLKFALTWIMSHQYRFKAFYILEDYRMFL